MPGWLLVTSVVVAPAAGCGSGGPQSSSTPSVTFPDTAAGRQARWPVRGARPPRSRPPSSPPISTPHFSPPPPPGRAELDGSSASPRSDSTRSRQPPATASAFVITDQHGDLLVNLAVDAHGRQPPSPRTGPCQPSIHHRRRPPAPAASSSVASGREETPPLTAILTLPAAKAKVPGVVLVGGSGPSDEDESTSPDKPLP